MVDSHSIRSSTERHAGPRLPQSRRRIAVGWFQRRSYRLVVPKGGATTTAPEQAIAWPELRLAGQTAQIRSQEEDTCYLASRPRFRSSRSSAPRGGPSGAPPPPWYGSVAAGRLAAEDRDELPCLRLAALGASRGLRLELVVVAHGHAQLEALATVLTLKLIDCHRTSFWP